MALYSRYYPQLYYYDHMIIVSYKYMLMYTFISKLHLFPAIPFNLLARVSLVILMFEAQLPVTIL